MESGGPAPFDDFKWKLACHKQISKHNINAIFNTT